MSHVIRFFFLYRNFKFEIGYLNKEILVILFGFKYIHRDFLRLLLHFTICDEIYKI